MKSELSIELRTLGHPALRAGTHGAVLCSRKTLAMLAYLSTKEDASESRERLAGLLWGDSTEEKARASLRQAISRFRETMPERDATLIEADRLDVQMSLIDVAVDHLDVLRGLEAGRIDDRLLSETRLPDTFLSGYEDIDEGFTNWLRVFRQSLHDALARKLENSS